MSKELSFNFHGVNMLLCTDRPRYLEATELIFARYRCEPVPNPDLRVKIVHADGFWGKEGNPESGEVLEAGMEKIGRRVFVRERTVYINRFVNYPGLTARCREDGDAVVFDLIYNQTYMESEIGLDVWQSGHQLFGIWPVAMYLAKKRDMFFLHGGAVAFAGRNIVFCGLQGVGKSTLLLRMLRDPESRFLSDNIYFYDAEKVYACPETIRIDDASLRFIAPPADLLRDTGHNSDLGRKMYVVNDARTAETIVPDIFIVPRFHPDKSEIVPANEDVKNMFAVFCELAMELNTFDQWSAPFLLDGGAFSTKRTSALDALLKDTPVVHLHIRKGDSPDSLLDLIRSHTRASI